MSDREYKKFAGSSVNNAGYHNHNWDLFHNGNELRDVSFPSLAAAIAAIGSSQKTLFITTQHRVTTKTTIPSNISVVVLNGGSFDIASGIVLTIAGHFHAGLFRVFYGLGAVTLSRTEKFTPHWWGAKGDGVTDDTAAINAAITAAYTAGGGKVYSPAGTYLISSPINILAKVWFCGEIGATTFKAKSTWAGDGYNGLITLRTDCQDALLSDFVVDGNKAQVPTSTDYVGIAALGCANVTFRNIISKNVNQASGGSGGDGLYINYDNNNTASLSRYLKFYDCTFDSNVRQGCSVIDGYSLSFYSCVFAGTTGSNPGAGVDIEPNGPTATLYDIHFYGCVFYGNAGRGMQIDNGHVAAIAGVSFVDCKSYNNGTNGFAVNGENQDVAVSLVRVEFTGNGSDEVLIAKSTGLSVIDCYIHDSGYNGIKLEHNTGSRSDNYMTEIRGNRIHTITKNGILVDAGVGGGPAVNIFRNNIINTSVGSGTYYGISFTASAAHNFGAIVMYNTIQSINIFAGSGYMVNAISIPVNCNKIQVMFNYIDGMSGNAIVNGGASNLILINFDGAVVGDAVSQNSVGINQLKMNGNLTITGLGEGVILNRSTGGGYINWQDGSEVDKFSLVRNNTTKALTLHAVGATNADLAGSQIINIRNNLNSADVVSIDTETKALTFGTLAGTGSRLVQADANGSLSASNLAAGLPRVLTINTTAVGNVLTGEDDLMTYSVPASTLATNGDSINITAAGRFALATVRLRAYFGSDLLFDTGSLVLGAAADWGLECDIIRTGATTQKAVVRLNTSFASFAAYCDYTTPGRTLSSANTFKLTGEATLTDDVICEIMKVRFEPAA